MKICFFILTMTIVTILTGCDDKGNDVGENNREVKSTYSVTKDEKYYAYEDNPLLTDTIKEVKEDKGEYYTEGNKPKTDRSSAEKVRMACIDAISDEDLSLQEFLNYKGGQLVFTDAASVEVEAKKVGECFANNLSEDLDDLKPPISRGAKEYVVTWSVEDDGTVKMEADVRFEDGTFLSDKEKEM